MEAISDVRSRDYTAQNGTISAYRQTQGLSQKEAQDIETDEEVGAKQFSKDDIKNVVNNLNKEVELLETNVRFGYNDKLDGLTVSVYEKDSNKVIRKFPTDEAIELMVKMREINGVIFDRLA